MKKNVLILLAVMLWGVPKAFAYDFSDVAPTGQTLYYNIVNGNEVEVTYPGSFGDFYSGYTKPTGNLTIPSTVTNGSTTYSVASIGNYAFRYCSGLTSVTIPNSVTSIVESAFVNCDHLTNISLGSGLQSIGKYAFKGCTQVVRIKSFATTAPTIDSTTFKNLSDDVILNVPCGYASAYENAAYWHRFDIQEELMYEFSVAPNDPSRGTVQIVTAPSCSNWEAQIQATAYHNFRFAHWSDGNTDNPRYIVVTQDVNLEAIFLDESETEGIGDVENGQLSVWCNGSTIIVEGLNGDVAHVFDAMGRQIATSSTIGNCEFELPAGVYLVKVGTSPARKVVVVR